MYKRWYICTAILCLFCIALSCLWMIAPQRIAQNAPSLHPQSADYYLLCDQGGLVQILHYTPDCTLPQEITFSEQAPLCVNLLPEQEALRIKAGYYIASKESLIALLANLYASLPTQSQ